MMANSNSNTSSAGGGCANTIALPLVFGAIGYFVYGQVGAGFLGVFLYALALAFISALGLIPVAGPFLYLWLGSMASSKILAAVALSATTLTTVIFWWYFVAAVIWTIIVIALIGASSRGY